MISNDDKEIEAELRERLAEVKRFKGRRPKGGDTTVGNMLNFRFALTGQTDRSCVLHATSYLDHELGNLIAAMLLEDEKKCGAMLGSNGPLGTFSSRNDLCYMLGLYTKEMHREIDVQRRIRNAFAHHPGHIRFSETSIANQCRSLRFVRDPTDGPRELFCSSILAALASVHGATRKAKRPPARPQVDIELWRMKVKLRAQSSTDEVPPFVSAAELRRAENTAKKRRSKETRSTADVKVKPV